MDGWWLHISTSQYGLTVVGDHSARRSRGGRRTGWQTEWDKWKWTEKGDHQGRGRVRTCVKCREREKHGAEEAEWLFSTVSTPSRGMLGHVGKERRTLVNLRGRPASYFFFFRLLQSIIFYLWLSRKTTICLVTHCCPTKSNPESGCKTISHLIGL